MNILGIDFGKKKVGVAIGDTDSKLAEPFRVLRYEDIRILSDKLKRITNELVIEKIVIGISEGESARKTKEFAERLERVLKIPFVYQDETLSTFEAQEKSREAGIGRKKRKAMEDAYSAAIILQDFL